MPDGASVLSDRSRHRSKTDGIWNADTNDVVEAMRPGQAGARSYLGIQPTRSGLGVLTLLN